MGAPLTPARTELEERCGALLDDLREREPLVQCITNAVVTGVTANVLLAVGASAAMVDLPGEAGPFATVASGLLVNLGTPHAEQRRAAVEAVAAARSARTPWVLDPVAIGSLPIRTPFAHDLVEQRPTIVRGNASEVLALAGSGGGGRGVDSTHGPEAALDAAVALARSTGGAVAVSGAVDLLTDGERVVRVHTGTPLLTKVTGGGCALGAVMAAFASLTEDPLEAAVAATTTFTVAAQEAATGASGPGTFAVALLDRLASLDGAAVTAAAVLS